MCRLTEQVVFSDPYRAAPVNRHTSPQLDAEAAALRADAPAKAAAAALKVRCCVRSGAALESGAVCVADQLPRTPLSSTALAPAGVGASWQDDVFVAGASAGYRAARAPRCWGCNKRREAERA